MNPIKSSLSIQCGVGRKFREIYRGRVKKYGERKDNFGKLGAEPG